ncbi:MAG: hypothetical protein EON61_05965 [Alphaproteobacteria bacterium]|nr:MAG: hypothetical protein EON61_05965 [Alphaproteobacteria bacterium]
MRESIVSGLMTGLLLAASPASAELPKLSDMQFARMVATVISVDHLKTRCTGSGAQSESAVSQATAWEAKNHAPLIRKAIAKLEEDAKTKRDLAAARNDMVTKFATAKHEPCTFLIATVTMPDSQFADTRQMAMLREEFGASSVTALASTASDAPSPVRSAEQNKRMQDLASKIEGFGFDYAATMGIGGGMAMRVFPVVLFKDGQALKDIEGLSFAAGMDAHKRANADDWTRWRREGAKLQKQTKKGWENLPFTAMYSKLPDGFKLNGRFQALGGIGNTALGGSDFVAAWSIFDFLPDGRVVKGGGAGGYSAFQQASTAFSGVAPERRGRYRVEGLMLNIAYDNKASEQFLIVSDPKDPSVIWLDGRSYTSKD